MKKSTKALLALLMSVVMITTLILPNYSWSDAADKRGKDNLATAGDAELSLAASVEQLNVLNLNLEKMISSHPETWSDIQTGEPIPNGTAIRLSFDWSVDNTADTVEEDVVVSYDLNLFGFKLDNITTGKVYFSDSTGKEMGTYTIVDGIFTVTINKDYYNANSEKKGKATLNGVIDVDQTGNEGSKDATLSAGGQTWPITITYDKKESVVSVSKTLGGDLTKTPDGNYIQPYTVTVGCQYDKITELNLTDAHGNAITSLGSFEYNGNTYDSLDALVAAATNSGAMDAGESFTFTYNAIVSKDCYAQESNDNDISNTLTATYKSNFDKPDESSSSSSTAKINRNKPNINKNGVLSEDGTEVTWTITIDCGDFTWDDVDLSEAIDTYTEGISGGETLTKTFTKDDFTTSDNRYYSTTYTTTISDTAAGSVTPVNVKNTYEKVKVDGNNYSGNATVTTNGASFVNKECVDQYKDSDGNKILVWETYLDIPDTEITNLHISDSIPWSWNSTHVLSGYNGFASTISIDGTNVFTWENDALKLLDTNNEIVTGNYYGVGDGFNIYLTDSYVAAHKNSRIVVRYETIVDSGPTAGKTFENKVSVGYNESPKAFEDTGSWTDHSINILSKWGEKNEDMDTVQYAVRAYFYEMKDRLKPGTVVLTDKFSNDYMEIVSLDDAYICSDLNPYYASSDVDVTSAVSMSKKQDGSVTFTTSLTQEQCDMMKEKGGLIIHYTARIKDPLKTTENISFTNTITGEFDGTSIGEQSMTNELTPNDIVTKAVAEYSADSAPNIKFTIKVNPTAADLVAGDTITAVDTMGSKLVFTSDNTISVTDTNTGQNVPFTYEYDQPNGRFIFTLPDETSLDITYTAKLTTIATDKQNPANNEQLTFENSGNTFSLEGQASDDTKDYYSEQRFSYVPNVSGTGTVSSLTLYKYYTKPDGSSATIGGSTFEVYETVRNGDTFSIDESKLFASKTLDADVNEWQITDLKLDTVYALKETGAANGFKVNKDITYFTIPGSNASSVPASVKEFAPNSIYNYKNEYNTGSLQVSKTLAGSALTPEDSDTEFEFTITLSGTADSGITAEDVTAEYSGVKFVKGVATIKLKGGESKTIDGIPQGLTYSVAETAVDEFTSSSTGATDKIGNGTTKTAAFTNTKGEVATVDISVTKVWEDDNNKYNTRPASIQVQLKANGIEKGDPITLNQADNNWTYTWTALPEEEAGSKITYTVEEVGTVNGYTAAVTGNATTGFTITNTLNKQYEDGEVTFKIQKYATGTTTPVVGAVFSITDKDGAKITATTGNDGIASFTVQPSGNADIIYTLAEDSAPAGYEKTDTTWTVTVKKDGTVTVKEQDADPLVLVYNWIAEIANLNKDANGNYVVYNNEIADLVITKTIKGDVTKEEAEGAISFKVTNSDGSYEKTIRLTDADVTYDEATKKYTITLKDIPVGTYTVEETTKDIAGNSVTVKYSVNGGSQKTGDTASNVSLTGGNTTTVDFENDYSADKGSLKIVKTTNGGTTPATAEFTIEGPNGYSKTVTYSEFTDGEYVINDLAPGTYTVTESVDSAKVEGYSLTVTGNGSTATVVKDDTASVELTNTYSEDKGSLKIVKTTNGGTTPATAEFTIEGPNGYSKTVTYGEFTSGEYVINDLAPGTYTVTESVDSAKVEGYSLTVTGNGSTATVVKDKTASVTLTNTYSEKPASLVITKTIKGDVTKEEAEGAISFTVTNSDGSYEKTIRLTDAGVTYDEATKKYTITLSNLPVDTYTVEETTKDIAGNSVTVKYSIDGGSQKTGDTASDISLTGGNTTTVDFENDYSADKGSLKIVKTTNGGTTPATAEFTIEGPNGYSKTVTYSEFTDGEYVINDLAPGTYTVTESIDSAKVEDYSLTVTGNGSTATVVKDDTASVELTNTYSEDKGDLKIVKTTVGGTTPATAVFTIEGTNGYSKTVTYGEFTSGAYVINDLAPGTYTVTESVESAKVDGYSLKVTGNGSTATVEKDKTASVTITNTYTPYVYEDGEVTFKIQKYATGTTTPVVGAVFSITDKDGAKITATTGNDGIASFTVQPSGNTDIIYTLAEDSAPAGYEKADTTWTVTVKKDGTVTVKEQDADPLVLVYNWIAEIANLNKDANGNYVVYNNEIADLVITKTIKGDVTKEEAEGAISFTVTNSDGSYEKTIRLTDADVTYDEATKKYTITLKDIPVGTYTVEETTKDIAGNSVTVKYSVNGGSQKTGDTASDVSLTGGNTTTVDFENDYSADKGSLKIVKTTNGGTTPATAEFTIEGPNGYSKTVTYGEFTNGAYVINDLVPGTYTVTESVDSAKVEGYSLTVTGNGSTATVVKDKTASVTLTNTYSEKPASLVITKTIKGDVTKEEAEGAISFTVTNSDGSYEKTIRLTDAGVTYDEATKKYTITLSNLPVDTYTVEETTKDIAGNSVTVKYSVDGGSQKTGDTASNVSLTGGNTTTVDFENDYSANTGKIRFTKVALYKETCAENSSATKPLEGVTFTLYQSDDTAFANPVDTAISNSDGVVEFVDVPYGTYAVKETTTKDGYIAIDDVFTATVDASNASTYAKLDGVKDNKVVNDVLRTDISLVKVNESDTNEKLPNSTYTLCAKEGAVESVIAESTTDVNGVLKFEGVLVGKEYTIKEISAPDGSYVSESPITIKYGIDNNGNVVIMSFDGGESTLSGKATAYVDDDGNITWLEPSVLYSFDKVDEKGNPLSGATLRLLDADGKQIDEWVTDGNSHEVNGILSIGKTYTLHEVSAPKGYELADDVIFTVSDDKVGAGENTVVTITMVDKKKDEPTTDEPTTDEPTTDEPTTDEPTTDEPTTDEPTTDEPGNPDEPKTGDEAPIAPAVVMFFVSLAACGVLVVKKRRNEKDN